MIPGLQSFPGLSGALFTTLVLLLYYLGVWWFYGQEPHKGPLIPLYAPPKNCPPELARYVAQKGFDPKIFSVAVINLAVAGFLKIEDNRPGDFWLKKKRFDIETLPLEQQKFLRILFHKNDQLAVHKDSHASISGAYAVLKSQLEQFATLYSVTNKSYVLFGTLLGALGAIPLVLSSKAPFLAGYGVVILLVSLATCFFAYTKKVRTWARAPWLRALIITGIFLVEFIGIYVLAGHGGSITNLFKAISPLAYALYLGTFGLHILFAKILQTHSYVGRKLMNQLDGFKMYLSTADQERMRTLHPPERTPELFEKYLPYALALNVENDWSLQFADIATNASFAPNDVEYTPSWLDSHAWQPESFSDFSSDLSGSFSMAVDNVVGSTSPVIPDAGLTGADFGSSGDSFNSGGFDGGGIDAGGDGGGGDGGGW